MSSQYNRELKDPTPMPQVELDSPAIQPVIQVRSFFTKVKVEGIEVPPGFNLRKFKLNRNGRTFPCYCIEPEEVTEDLPALLYFHGGGFLLPIQTPMVEKAVYFAEHLRCRVFLPEYVLTTKAPFPAALEDALAALQFLLGHHEYLRIDAQKVLLYGESAGGCLTASLVRLYLDQQAASSLAGVALLYPVLDNSMNYPSMSEFATSVFSATPNYSMWSMYLDMDLKNHPWREYAIPAQNRDFSGFPPVYVEAAEMDILRDEARAYAARLEEAGIPVRLEVVEGAYHAYDNDHDSPLVQRMMKRRTEVLREFLQEKEEARNA